jgi:nascent polypeptide-associated complex subunit beta
MACMRLLEVLSCSISQYIIPTNEALKVAKHDKTRICTKHACRSSNEIPSEVLWIVSKAQHSCLHVAEDITNEFLFFNITTVSQINIKMTDDIATARAAMIAKRFGGNSAKSGGKGAVRRNKKGSNRSSSAQSDAKLGVALKKLGATNIPQIEEVNFFKEDGDVIHFVNPRVQAAIQSNTYVISGPNETKPLQELLPSLVSQLGMDNIAQLQNFAAAAGAGAAAPEVVEDDDNDEVPDLVDGNFEEVSEEK